MEASLHYVGDNKASSDPRHRSVSSLQSVDPPREGLFSPNHLVMPREYVRGIGSIACVGSRFVQAPHGVFRQDQLLIADTDVGLQFIRRTFPGVAATNSIGSNEQQGHNIGVFPGFTEVIDGGTAQGLHDNLATLFPHSQILSFGNEGVSRGGPTVGWTEGFKLTFGQMANVRLRLMRALGGQDPTLLLATSMGSPIINKLERQNLQNMADSSDEQINIDGSIKISPALIRRTRTAQKMLLQFPLHMAVDGLREAVRNPQEAAEVVSTLGCIKRSAPAMLGNIKNLLHGTHPDNVSHTAAVYPTGFIIGERDPLREQELCLRLADAHPETVRVHLRAGKGHAFSLNARETAGAIQAMHEELQALGT